MCPIGFLGEGCLCVRRSPALLHNSACNAAGTHQTDLHLYLCIFMRCLYVFSRHLRLSVTLSPSLVIIFVGGIFCLAHFEPLKRQIYFLSPCLSAANSLYLIILFVDPTHCQSSAFFVSFCTSSLSHLFVLI